jgi:hypothetical protein
MEVIKYTANLKYVVYRACNSVTTIQATSIRSLLCKQLHNNTNTTCEPSVNGNVSRKCKESAKTES